MRLVIASVGSLGDVHPFIAIGQAMQARGHAVTLVCNDDFAAAVRQAGLDHASAGATVNLGAAMANPALWHPIKGLGVFWKHMLAPAIEPTCRHIQRIAADGPCAVLAPPVMFGARLACDALRLPLISAYTSPAVLRRDRAPLTMAHWQLPRGTPRVLVRSAWRALDHHKLHPMAAGTLRASAHRLGMAPPPDSQSLFGEWMHSPDGGITLFPEWFAPARPGWPPWLRFGGFPLYQADAMSPLPEDVRCWLAAGSPPVVFMPGSAMQHAHGFFTAAVDACGRLGRRALLLTPHTAQLPEQLPAHARRAAYLPFAALLPHAAALVHHGGIGSCAQALQAGIPQLVMPMAHDQFDNADCLRQLGVGIELRVPHFAGERLAEALLRTLSTQKESLQRCRDRLATPALPGLCDSIEAMVVGASRTPHMNPRQKQA